MSERISGAGAVAASRDDDRAAALKLVLVGNPNVGKSVVFGALTRRYVTVSNYPGTTVEVTRGAAKLGDNTWQLLDTPGTNRLLPGAEDERVTRDILLETGDAPVLQVADAKNLRRALILFLELADLGRPLLLALNMQDEARARGVAVDSVRLEELLGVPVVETVAIHHEGLDRLAEAIPRCHVPARRAHHAPEVEVWVDRLLPHLADQGPRARFFALQILAGDDTIDRHLESRTTATSLAEMRRVLHGLSGEEADRVASAIRDARLREADRILDAVYRRERPATADLGSRISTWALHPVKGLFLLAGLLLVTFWFVGLFGAGTLVDAMEQGLFGQVVNPTARRVVDVILPFPHVHGTQLVSFRPELPLTPSHGLPLGPTFQRTVASALYEIPAGTALTRGQEACRFTHDLLVGPYGALTMGLSYGLAIVLPIVATFFLLFSLMEDSGYLPRLAVIVHRVFRSMGLNGKAVLPMVLGLGCDTMATMTTRILETRKQRLIVTLLLALGVPCSAQLGVLLAMLSHVSPLGTLVWFVVISGVMVAVGYLAARLFPGDNSDFLLELPPIRRPVLSNILIKTLARIEWYLREVLPLFLLGTLLLFVLDRTHAIVGIRNLAAPVVQHWLGLPAAATDAFVVGFLRRDYGAVFLLQAATGLHPILDGTQVLVSMVVITLFVPCIANVFIIVKEHGWKIALAMAAFIFPFAFFVGGLVRLGAQWLGIHF